MEMRMKLNLMELHSSVLLTKLFKQRSIYENEITLSVVGLFKLDRNAPTWFLNVSKIIVCATYD